MPSVTDWISSIGSLVGALTGVGALVVAVLSYRKSTRALAADAQTRGAVASTVDAVEALGLAGGFNTRPGGPGYALRPEEPDREQAEAYEAALQAARRGLGPA
ncbi:hypothetical protein H9651_09650 [Microbacterium sp. Sa4CUA7]|uniref:Uncharacterized protein n=1 Tax=Microbacterium pullorum TaxID=2762236 RepID=A0ABR8S367_9MICO|nr:hypothetical protein [Microbacterium pullorum]MBD7957900.1 hypothetical protein [Microbacterium pullorum]